MTNEQGNQTSLQPDGWTERNANPIFRLRFGCGAHSLQISDWHNVMVQDMAEFFQSSQVSQRNIFFMEDAFGTDAFQSKIKKAYRIYGKYATAWAYANIDLSPWDGFPPATSVIARYNRVLATQVPVLSDGLRFSDKILDALDEIIQRKRVHIDFALETRRDSKERAQIETTVTYMEMHGSPRSVEEFRQYVLRAWNMRKLRDQKIIEDLAGLYKKAFKQKEPTKVYVSLGEDHAAIADMMTSKLYRKPSHEVTLITRPLYPQYEGSVTNVVMERAFVLMDARVTVSPQQWQDMFTEITRSFR